MNVPMAEWRYREDCKIFSVIRNERLQVFRGNGSPCNLCPSRGGKGEGGKVVSIDTY